MRKGTLKKKKTEKLKAVEGSLFTFFLNYVNLRKMIKQRSSRCYGAHYLERAVRKCFALAIKIGKLNEIKKTSSKCFTH